jgi:glycosyltransferase involved in cell wall biosynthesis
MFKYDLLPLIVITTSTQWDEPPRMRHHITLQLIRWFNVLYIECFPYNNRNESTFTVINERLIVCRPQMKYNINKQLYANDPLTHTIINRLYLKEIKKCINKVSKNKFILVSFIYYYPELMFLVDSILKIYICVDEFPAMRRIDKKKNNLILIYQKKLFQYYENMVAKNADLCLTPHQLIKNKLLKLNKNVYMLLHAHNGIGEKVQKKNNVEKIIKVGFMGYIHYRINKKWLERLVVEKDIELYLIGPIDDQYDISDLKNNNNFHLINSVPESKLRKILSEMDVLIIPYIYDIPETIVMTTASKLYQYIDSGKPIVISPLPNFIEFQKGVLYRAENADDFVDKIRQAMGEDCDEYRNIRAKIAAENTWDKRGEQLVKIIEKNIGSIIKINK